MDFYTRTSYKKWNWPFICEDFNLFLSLLTSAVFQPSVKSLSSKPVIVDVMFSSLVSSMQCVYARHVMQGNTSFSTNLELQIFPLCIIQTSMLINDLLVIEAPGGSSRACPLFHSFPEDFRNFNPCRSIQITSLSCLFLNICVPIL